jgi:hypothetical protein
MAVKLNAVDAFIKRIRPEILAEVDTEAGISRYSYHCSMINLRGEACKGSRLNTVGPDDRRFQVCMKDLTKYNEAHDYLVERLKADHAEGLHGEGEERKQFAETHTDSTGWFSLRCTECRDEIAGEELGVAPGQVDEARTIARYRDRALESYESAQSSFMEVWSKDPALAMDRYGENVRKHGYTCRLWGKVALKMEADYTGRKLGLVDAYEEVQGEVKLSLIHNTIHSTLERECASSFVMVADSRGW